MDLLYDRVRASYQWRLEGILSVVPLNGATIERSVLGY